MRKNLKIIKRTMFKEYNQEQDFLLPPSFREYLGEGHEVIILSEIIEELNLEKLLKEYNKNIAGNGRPAYNPKMLLKVLFYGYMNQTFSSRKLAGKVKSDLGFMYLTGNNKPDFRTINRFRKEKGYWNEENYKYLEKSNISSYIPHQENSGKNLDDYVYEKSKDTYEDKDGNIFNFKQFMGRLDGTGNLYRKLYIFHYNKKRPQWSRKKGLLCTTEIIY